MSHFHLCVSMPHQIPLAKETRHEKQLPSEDVSNCHVSYGNAHVLHVLLFSCPFAMCVFREWVNGWYGDAGIPVKANRESETILFRFFYFIFSTRDQMQHEHPNMREKHMTSIKPITKRIRKKQAAEVIALIQKQWFFQRMRHTPQNRNKKSRTTTVSDPSNDTDRNLLHDLIFPFPWSYTKIYDTHIKKENVWWNTINAFSPFY